MQSRLEGDGQNGDPDFGAPARRQPGRRRFPDAVPVGVVALAAWIDDGVVSRAGRIDRKHVAGSAVRKRPEDDADVIFGGEDRIPTNAEADDARRIRLVAHDPDDDRAGVCQHPDVSTSAGRRAFDGIRLAKILDRRG